MKNTEFFYFILKRSKGGRLCGPVHEEENNLKRNIELDFSVFTEPQINRQNR